MFILNIFLGQFSFLLHSCELDEKNADCKGSPQHSTSSADNNEQKEELSENVVDNDSVKSEDQTSVSELSTDLRTNSGFSDLDILPTKDCSIRGDTFIHDYKVLLQYVSFHFYLLLK